MDAITKRPGNVFYQSKKSTKRAWIRLFIRVESRCTEHLNECTMKRVMIYISNVAESRSRRALERNPANCMNTITWKLIPSLRMDERVEMVKISQSAFRLPSYTDFLWARRNRFCSCTFVRRPFFFYSIAHNSMETESLVSFLHE